MAHDNPTADPRRLNAAPGALPPDPAAVYEANAELIFGMISWFLPEPHTSELARTVAQDLLSLVPKSGYARYSHLVCFRAVFLVLKRHEAKAKVPPAIGFDEAFCLYSRDKLALSCFEIGAIVGTSEGSIRTRLERARARMFAPSPNDALEAPAVTETRRRRPENTGHSCLQTRESVEDWNIAGARLGRLTTPPAVARAAADCKKCDKALKDRLSSLASFRDLPAVSMPDSLKTFPVSPLFLKEGKRMLLNWSAAPWYVKALFEGLLATSLVLGIVLSIPRIKGLYEFWLERRLDLYSVAELAAGLAGHSETVVDNAGAPAGAPSHPPQTATPTVAGASNDRLTVKPETEFGTRESEIASSEKVYRVLIKTDSPEAIKDQVLQSLTAARFASADEETPLGAELPGGVMFDVLVPLKSYKPLVNELARMGETKVIITRNKERAVPGKARLKIWLQRI